MKIKDLVHKKYSLIIVLILILIVVFNRITSPVNLIIYTIGFVAIALIEFFWCKKEPLYKSVFEGYTTIAICMIVISIINVLLDLNIAIIIGMIVSAFLLSLYVYLNRSRAYK